MSVYKNGLRGGEGLGRLLYYLCIMNPNSKSKNRFKSSSFLKMSTDDLSLSLVKSAKICCRCYQKEIWIDFLDFCTWIPNLYILRVLLTMVVKGCAAANRKNRKVTKQQKHVFSLSIYLSLSLSNSLTVERGIK